MTFTTRQSCLRTIKFGDPKFHIVDGSVVAPRAGFEISQSCPKEYRIIIQECINYGWLKPVATIKDNELFWEEFQK
jgi:hypothetical protein